MQRPFVSTNLALSADGKLGPARGAMGRFTSAADRDRMDRLRAEADAVLVGARTLRQTNAPMHVRAAEHAEARRARGILTQPRTIVWSQSGELPCDLRIFGRPTDAHRVLEPALPPLIVCSPGARPAAASTLGERAQWLPVASESPDVAAFLAQLWRQDIRHLLIEGGGETLWPFVAAGALDVWHVTYAPCLLGGQASPSALGGPGRALDERTSLTLTHLTRIGDEIFCSYSVQRKRNSP
jgi:riboflavin-specific deaminase-like protein